MADDIPDDLDAFLDEIENLDGEGAAADTSEEPAASSSSTQPAPVTATENVTEAKSNATPKPASATAVVSKPPVKATNAEPTKAVYASQPVRNTEPSKVSSFPSLLVSALEILASFTFAPNDCVWCWNEQVETPPVVQQPPTQRPGPPPAFGGSSMGGPNVTGMGMGMGAPQFTTGMQPNMFPPQTPLMHMHMQHQQHGMPGAPMMMMQQQPATAGEAQEGDKKKKTMRMAADKIWEDTSLADWPAGENFEKFMCQIAFEEITMVCQ
jgi:hypothetical protein